MVKLIAQTQITELLLENKEMKLTIRKNHDRHQVSSQELSIPAEKDKQDQSMQDSVSVLSPLVGTFYRTPTPDLPPFIKQGDLVKKGQTLCIIEAMKSMNEIKAELAGEIVEILVDNGEPVEYGQPLFIIRRIS